VFDFGTSGTSAPGAARDWVGPRQWDKGLFRVTKRVIDIVLSLLLVPVVVLVALVLLCLNPFLNRGPLFFVQKRMGRFCVPFNAIKFRSMTGEPENLRSAECPLEVDRITPVGQFMRQTRLDELPQIFNVLKGEMSLIGPRPDYYEHALHFMQSVPGYRNRHMVRPGISGLAQTEIGYASGSEETRRKVQADLYYMSNTGLRMELWLIWRTLSVIIHRKGS